MPATWVKTTDLPIAKLVRFPGNARRGNVEEIRASIRRHGQYRAIVVRDCDDGMVILAGNHTRDALEAEGFKKARCEVITCDDDEARRINLADNKLAELGDYEAEALAELLAALDGDLEGTGWSEEDLETLLPHEPEGGPGGDEDRPSLADRFLIPPFDVLDTEQGPWRTRKRQWLSLGIRSEEGREADDGEGGKALTFEGWTRRDPRYYDKKRAAEQEIGRKLTAAEFEAEHYQPPETALAGGTSIFDPVLCELAYRWFSPAAGVVLDPFAGGSVRGLVAAILGRRYTGNDLSEVQIKANMDQAAEFIERGLITDALTNAPQWSTGDSADWVGTLTPESADMIFTCPPYYDLERYSDDRADLSTMTRSAFDLAFARILAGAAAALRKDRFAVIVTGDARDKRGHLHDLRGPTIQAAASAGLDYCSGAILATSFGSLPMVVARAFTGTRTLGRRHQDVLVFCKGSRNKAAKACGDVEIHTPEAVTDAWDGS